MERSKLKILYNPFEKSIAYERFDTERGIWVEPDNSSKLVDKKFTKASIQNIAYDLTEVIEKVYYDENVGLDIEFAGTEDDFDDLRFVFDSVFSGKDIQLVKIQSPSIAEASEALSEIDEVYERVDDILSKYEDEDIKAEVDRYHNLTKPQVLICVVGTSSSGKSAFINALIGWELLKSESEPSTAKLFKIISSNTFEIHFVYCSKEVKLEFDEKRFDEEQFKVCFDEKIVSDLNKEISEGKPTDAMYRALETLNSEKIGDIEDETLEVFVKFRNTALPVDKFEFVIYDTPGSGTDSHEDHTKILEKALGEQECGLPIVVADPDRMDFGEDLIKLLEDCKKTLDQENALVVVNKSDGKNVKDLEKFKDTKRNLLTQWKPSRIFFVSSIIGLGSKMLNPNDESWLDSTYEEVFEDCYVKFCDPTHKRYKQLYRLNLMPKDQHTQYCDWAENCAKEKLMYINSGIHCVEWEIANFAQRCADYNRCVRAKECLEEAVAKTNEKHVKAEEEIKRTSKTLKKELDEKQQVLIDQIEERKSRLVSSYEAEYLKMIFSIGLNSNSIEQNQTIASEMWKNIKHDKNVESPISEFEKKLKALLNDELWRYARQLKNQTEDFWNKKEADFKSQIMCVITGATFLSEDKRNELGKYVFKKMTPSYKHVDFDLDAIGGIRARRFLFFKTGLTVDIKKCAGEYAKTYQDQIFAWNRGLVNTNSERFKKWTDDLITGIQGLMSRWNPELHDLSAKLEGVEKLKESMVVIGGKLESALQELDMLTQFKEGENI